MFFQKQQPRKIIRYQHIHKIIPYTVYTRIFHTYFFWNLAKKNRGVHIIWNKVGTAPPSNKWSRHVLRSAVWITCGYKISLSRERKLYSWLVQKTKYDLKTNSNSRAFRSQKMRHLELEKRLCDHVDDKRQYGCTVTSEMCQLKPLAINQWTKHHEF